MKIKCGNCGRNIIVPDDLVAGQHVRCPYCNEKTAFDKPSRIALPEGFEVKRRARTKIEALKRAHQLEVEAHEETKHKLGLIRPAAQSAGPDLNAEAIKRRMEEEAQNKLMAGEKAAAAQSVMRRDKVIRRAVVVALLVLVAVAIGCWIGWASRERTRKRIDMLQRHEQRMREEERQRNVREEEAARRRADKEAADKELRLAAEEESRKAFEARRQKMLEEERAREALRQEAERRNAECCKNAETYKGAVLAFRGGRFCMANNDKIAAALGTRTDEFYFCFAKEGDRMPIYEVSSASNGVRRVVKMFEDGTAAEEDFGGFTNRIGQESYLMAHGSQVCYRSMRTHPMSGRLVVGNCMDPTQAFFDKMYETVRTLELEYDELAFDVVFRSASSKKEIAVASVGFGCEVSVCQLRAAVVEAFPMVEQEKRLKVKKFKRTAVFWNGSLVKRGIDGMIYVPRCFSASDYASFSRWQAMKQRVEEEEAAEQEYYNNAQMALDEKMSKVNEERRKKWCAEIRDLIKQGTLGYRGKIAKEN